MEASFLQSRLDDDTRRLIPIKSEPARTFTPWPVTRCGRSHQLWFPASHSLRTLSSTSVKKSRVLTFEVSSIRKRRPSLQCCSLTGVSQDLETVADIKMLQSAVKLIRPTMVLSIACACALFSKDLGYAAESGALNITPVIRQSKHVLGVFGTMITKVLGVFRDQGVMLSILLGLSAFFSMAETSITTLWPWKVRELAEKETEGGVFHMLRRDVTRFLTTILIGTTVANIAATALVTDAATTLFGEAGVTAATGVMTVVILLLTEITPKSIAVHNATEVARIVVRPVAWLSYFLYPLGRIVTTISMALLKFLGLKSSGEPFVTEEELKLMLRGAELSGAIEEEEQDMIENVLEIKDTYVREVMTPLIDVVAIDSSATLLDFHNLWVTHQYSRVPVFERRVDNIVGIVYAMDMLDYVEQVELLQRLSVGRIAHKPAYFVPDSMSVWNLLREFRIRKVHMAIVLNEYGGAIGVVTLEDVVEEIVGEIFDENDSKEEIRRKTGYVVQRADGVFDVDANTSIEDLREALEVKLPESPYHYETVSGFVCEAFGYIPRTGEGINVILQKAEEEDSDRGEGDSDSADEGKAKFQKYRLEILAGNARKVGSVRFERLDGIDAGNDKGTVAHVFPRVFNGQWDGKSSLSQGNTEEMTPHPWDSEGDVSSDDDDTCNTGEVNVMSRYLIAESVDVDNISDSDDACDGADMHSPKGLCIIADGVEVVDSQTLAGKDREGTVEVVNAEYGTEQASAMVSKEQKIHDRFLERRLERRNQRRRRQTEDAVMELEKHRKIRIKRKEAAMGMKACKSQQVQPVRGSPHEEKR